ncbi:MAG: S41 family peptidase [bacterium JZ-2024 1]
MNPRKRWALAILLALISFWMGVLADQIVNQTYLSLGGAPARISSALAEADALIRDIYYDPVRAGADELRDGALSGYVHALRDPFSYYIPQAAAQSMAQTFQGEFGGIGIAVEPVGNSFRVFSVLPGTPAEKAGLKPGDTIVAVGDRETAEMEIFEVVESIRGPVGTSVRLTIWREGLIEPRKVELTRVKIEVPSVSQIQKLSDDTGYFRIEMFNEKTPEQVNSALEQLARPTRLRWVIIDLRYNGGGLLDSGVQTSDIFLKEGTIVSVRGKKVNELFSAKPGGKGEHLRVAVLVNEYTASASEIFAAAIRENRRGFLLGQKTFGKGSVQMVVPLTSGGSLALVTAHYFTPSGKNISGEGLQPDIALPSKPSEVPELRAFAEALEQSARKSAEAQQEFDRALDRLWIDRALAAVKSAGETPFPDRSQGKSERTPASSAPRSSPGTP